MPSSRLLRLLGIVFAAETVAVISLGIPPLYAALDGGCLPRPVPFPTIRDLTGLKEPAFVVITDSARLSGPLTAEDRWEELWGRLHAGWGFQPPLPEVDFTMSSIVGVFLGVKPDSGYTVRITDVEKIGYGIAIEVLSIEAGPECLRLQILTAPAHIVIVPYPNLMWYTFEIETVSDEACGRDSYS